MVSEKLDGKAIRRGMSCRRWMSAFSVDATRTIRERARRLNYGVSLLELLLGVELFDGRADGETPNGGGEFF